MNRRPWELRKGPVLSLQQGIQHVFTWFARERQTSLLFSRAYSRSSYRLIWVFLLRNFAEIWSRAQRECAYLLCFQWWKQAVLWKKMLGSNILHYNPTDNGSANQQKLKRTDTGLLDKAGQTSWKRSALGVYIFLYSNCAHIVLVKSLDFCRIIWIWIIMTRKTEVMMLIIFFLNKIKYIWT